MVRATRATRARPRPLNGSRSTARSRSSEAAAVRRGVERASRPAPASTRPRTADDASDGPAASSSACERGIATTRSKRSSRARDTLSRYAATRRRSARAVEARVATTAARAEIHRRDEPESGREQRAATDARDGHDAVLEGLPERLEHRPRELRQLVQEKDAAMGEADLARPRDRPAADDRRCRRAVVRRAERGRVDEPGGGAERSRDGVDPRHLERLRTGERRQDGRQPARQHRLPGARRAGEQQVVRARSRDLERPPTTFLSADVGEVRQRHAGRRPLRRLGRLDRVVAEEVADRLGEVSDADRLDACERSLLGRVDVAEHASEPGTGSALGGRDRAGDRADAPVEAELADAGVLLEPLARDLRRRGEHRQRDRQVESGPLLPQRRRREVDRDRAVGPLEESGVDAAPDAVLRLLAGAVGEPDDRERRERARAQVRLDLDAPRLEADERERDRAAEHPSTVRPITSRDCADSVPEVSWWGRKRPHHGERGQPT